MKEALVSAYMAAGWSMKGVLIKGNPAPKTVQTYSSVIRKAVELGINPSDYGTWSQFRKATGAPAPKWFDQGEKFISSLPKEERAAMAARFADMISLEIMEATMKAAA